MLGEGGEGLSVLSEGCSGSPASRGRSFEESLVVSRVGPEAPSALARRLRTMELRQRA